MTIADNDLLRVKFKSPQTINCIYLDLCHLHIESSLMIEIVEWKLGKNRRDVTDLSLISRILRDSRLENLG